MSEANSLINCPGVSVETQSHGLDKVVIDNDLGRCELYLHGAHITSFTPKGETDLLWLSPKAVFCADKAIRGGIPICWPWFGAHPSDSSKPAHGFARVTQWQLDSAVALENGATQVCLKLSESEQSLSLWPHRFELVYQIVVGKQLDIALTVTNTDESAFDIGGALHSYFNIHDVEQVSIKGLDGICYRDKVEGFAQNQQNGDIKFTQEVDRVYIDTEDTCYLQDPGFDRTIEISKSGSDSTIVWNPWQDKSQSMADMSDDGYQTMVCIEAGSTGGVNIAPGQQHCLAQSIKCRC